MRGARHRLTPAASGHVRSAPAIQRADHRRVIAAQFFSQSWPLRGVLQARLNLCVVSFYKRTWPNDGARITQRSATRSGTQLPRSRTNGLLRVGASMDTISM